MALKIIATIQIKQDHIEMIKQEALKLIVPTRKEVGCLEYFLLQNSEQEDVLIMIETWENEDALAIHFATPHLKQFAQALEGVATLSITKAHLIA
ncbi:putative quinol monooxygenase [Sulfurospirillum sp.]|uniref:putative quinol monooxygenase n=1 Tax=Sulfurospirillum sp. TaxID=2053622 RepID=UPI002FDDF4B1